MDKITQDETGGLVPPIDLPSTIEHWTAAGLISPDQATSLRADVEGKPLPAAPVPAGHERRTSLLIEALGYLGGAIILAAFMLVISQFWEDFTATTRLVTIATGFLAFVIAGLAVPQRLAGTGRRLRSVLWLGASITWAALLAFIGNEYLSLNDERLGLFAAGISIPLAAVLWFFHRQPLQHVAFLASVTVAAATGVTVLSGPSELPGVAVWCVGVAWFVLAWGGIVRPYGLGIALGSILAVFGGIIAMSATGDEGSRSGAILALVTLASVVVAAVLFRDFMLLVIAAIGTLQGMPIAMSIFFPGTLWAALALLVIGAALIGAALVIARGRRRQTSIDRAALAPKDWGHGGRLPAIITSGVVVAGTAAAVVTASLIA